jgi:poly(3-hydroxybutyrate) depolymerase
VGRFEPDVVDDGWRVRVDEWGSCQAGARVALYTIIGAGHVWPAGDIDPAMALAEFFLGDGSP